MKVFVDSMVYLHYRNLQEIDLPKLLDVERVCVVVPRITLRELDMQKNTHSASRVRDRVRRILQKLEEWIRTREKIRSNVEVEFFAPAPNIDFGKHGLNPNWNDDILIASVLHYKSVHLVEDVLLITQDPGAKLTAEALGIAVFQLPDEYRLPPEPDPLEIENRELRKTLERIRNAQPKLVVCFAGEEEEQTFARFVLPPPPQTMEEEIRCKLEELRSKFPKQHPRPAPGAQLAGPGDIFAIPDYEYDRYNQDVDIFLSDYDKYMRETWEMHAFAKRAIFFEVEIRNVGTAPAEDVDVELYFPDGFQLMSGDDDLPNDPVEPRPPRNPRSRTEIMADGIVVPSLHRPSLTVPQFTPKSLSIKRTGSYTVSDHCERIKHGARFALPELLLAFDSYESASSFKCEYKVTLANLPDSIMGELHFIIEKENGNIGLESGE